MLVSILWMIFVRSMLQRSVPTNAAPSSSCGVFLPLKRSSLIMDGSSVEDAQVAHRSGYWIRFVSRTSDSRGESTGGLPKYRLVHLEYYQHDGSPQRMKHMGPTYRRRTHPSSSAGESLSRYLSFPSQNDPDPNGGPFRGPIWWPYLPQYQSHRELLMVIVGEKSLPAKSQPFDPLPCPISR